MMSFDVLSAEFLKRKEPQYDSQLVADAQNWYTRFTGGIGKAEINEIVEMYIILAKDSNKVVDK